MVSCAGAVNTFHQPLALMSVGERSEDSSSPTVGISQNSPTSTRRTRIAPPPVRAAIRAASDGFAFTTPSDVVIGVHSLRIRRMLNAHHRDHQQQQKDGDRAAQAQVRVRAERRAVQLERQDVRVVLRRARRDDEDQVEDLQHVDHQRDEDDREDRRQQRHGDLPEDLPLVGAVHPCRFEQFTRHAREARRDQHHREARPHPDVDADDGRGDQRRAEPVDAVVRLPEVLGGQPQQGAVGLRRAA